jgi:hypothetical protein
MTDIGDAIQEMREGGKVKRKDWKGKWLELEESTIMLKSDAGQSHGWLGDPDESIADDLDADDWEGLD